MLPSDIPASGATPGPEGSRLPGKKLDSWGEIASYLGREVRTVQRWERTEGLPVHRHEHKKKSTVYAYAGELDAWIKKRQPKDDPDADAAFVPDPDTVDVNSGGESAIHTADPPSARVAIEPPRPAPKDRVDPRPSPRKRVARLLAAAAILGLIVYGVHRWFPA